MTTSATTGAGTSDDGTSSADATTSDDDPGGTTAGAETSTGDDGETTAAEVCGDGLVEGREECDGDRRRLAQCEDLDGFVGGELSCDPQCLLDTSECWPGFEPGAGDLVITEIMQNPAGNTDATDEWFEIHNPTESPLNLAGCEIGGNMSDMGFVIEGSLPIEPDGYIIISPNTPEGPSVGFPPEYRWPTMAFSLNNNDDEIHIDCAGGAVDAVQYDNGATFPNPNGESMALDPTSTDASSNNDGANWCLGTSSYGPGDNLGTPGGANDPCP